jgi:hypothetical protein
MPSSAFPSGQQVPGTFTAAEAQTEKKTRAEQYKSGKEVPGTF